MVVSQNADWLSTTEADACPVHWQKIALAESEMPCWSMLTGSNSNAY